MDYDQEKVDDATLALMWLVLHSDKVGTRAWKGFDRETLHRLYEKGFISDPYTKAKSVRVFAEGEQRAEELFGRMFGSEHSGG